MFLLLLLLPCLSWSIPNGCFQRVRHHTLIGTMLATLNDVTLPQCQRACLEMKKQSCRSFMYHAAKSRCYLNSGDKESRGSSLFHVLDAVDYYHRTCYHTPSMVLKHRMAVKRDSVFDDKCYEVVEGKVLIGIVDQLIQDVPTLEQCKRRCQKSKEASDIICKSAIYYKKEKECIIASQSRTDIPDLFIDDDQATYMENKCFNNGTNGMKEIQLPTGSVPEDLGAYVGPSPAIVAPTTLAETYQETRKTASLLSNVELSGYDAPSDTVSDSDITEVNTAATKTTTAVMDKLTTTIEARVIDTYNVNAAVKAPAEVSYGKRFRDSKLKDCFTEVRPLHPMEQTRVTKAYSLEQCTDICRLCWRCLHGKKCLSVAFDVSRDLCAFSTSHIVDGGNFQDLDVVIYHNRNEC